MQIVENSVFKDKCRRLNIETFVKKSIVSVQTSLWMSQLISRKDSLALMHLVIQKTYIDPRLVGEENGTFFTRVWKPLPSKRVLKTLRGSPKRKTQRGQYLLAVGLSYYSWYQSQTPSDVSARRRSPEGEWT